MKKVFVGFFLIVLSLVIMNGCTMTDATLKLKYNIPDVSAKIDTISEISIKNFIDTRKVDDPKFVYYKNNNYGQTIGKLSSEDISVADFITELVRRTAKKAGIRIVDNSEFVLSGKIFSLDSVGRVGFWSIELESTLQGEIQLKKGSQIVRKDSIIEKGKVKDISMVTVSDYEDSLEKLFGNLSTSVLDFIKSSLTQPSADK